MKKNASITVFLALILVCVSSLILSLVESARTAGTRYFLQTAADSAMDSVFSEYSRQLWDDYRIIFYECEGEETAAAEYEKFLSPYIESDGFYKLDAPNITVTDMQSACDRGGEWFEKNILDYMHFGIINSMLETDTENSPDELWQEMNESQSMEKISETYGEHSKEAISMEKSVMKIADNLKLQKDLYEQAGNALTSGDCDKFTNKAKQLKTAINSLPDLIEKYTEKADKLGIHLDETATALSQDMDRLSPVNRQKMDEQIGEYREYTDRDGERRVEITGLTAFSEANISFISQAVERAEEIEDEMDDDYSDSDDDEDVDEDALWDEVMDIWNEISIPVMNSAHGIADEGKNEAIHAASDLMHEGVLALVIPEDRTVSAGTIDTSLFPSVTSVTSRISPDVSLTDRMLLNEYSGRFFTCFTDNSQKEFSYEMEYLFAGMDSDRSNLEATLTAMLAIREGLNFIHILTDAQKRTEVSTLALAISGGGALPGLNILVECLIMATWALGESFMDLRALLDGKKIPLLKRPDEWQLDLDGLLSIGTGGSMAGTDSGDKGRGLDYESYLKLLLYLKSPIQRDYRMMDMIQYNMRRKEPEFVMKNCFYGMNISTSCESRHLFTSLGMESFAALDPQYTVTVSTVKAY